MAKSRIHSVLTALPVLMLVGGLYIYYNGEQSQREGALLMAEAIELHGDFKGLSEVKSGGEGQHYLWLIVEGRSRGVRLSVVDYTTIQSADPPLAQAQSIVVNAAPRVAGSRVLWLAGLQRQNDTLVELALPQTDAQNDIAKKRVPDQGAGNTPE